MQSIESHESKIERAKAFATAAFLRAGLQNHFLEVFTILKDEFGITDEDTLIAGLLHDTLEDTNTTYEDIQQTFSKRAADIVQEVSHPKNYNNIQRAAYYEQLKSISPGGKLIKLADFTSHLKNFIAIYERNEQHLHPKFVNNDKYISSIREFLESCPESDGKRNTFLLTQKLEGLL